ncbi:MAG: hypothetical protein KDI71_22040 [Xanthomonadales bacterium]|nr:hypothetical protein [Xanthomonadales bacterium]
MLASPGRHHRVPVPLTLDGSTRLIELRAGRRYWTVERWSLARGGVAEIAERLLILSGIRLPE